MRCPECGNEMKKGIVEVKDVGSILQLSTMATWYPEDEKKKKVGFRKNAVNLALSAEGYYCDECMKVFAVFEER